jgi:hypothetical protein
MVPPKDGLAHVCENKVTISNLNACACLITSKVTWDPWPSTMTICLFVREIPPNVDLLKNKKEFFENKCSHPCF